MGLLCVIENLVDMNRGACSEQQVGAGHHVVITWWACAVPQRKDAASIAQRGAQDAVLGAHL